MNANDQENHQKILDSISQIQSELESILKGILEQTGNKLKPEGREEFQKNIEDTRQLLERLKSRYA